MKVKNIDVLRMFAAIESSLSLSTNKVKFKYALSRNKRILQPLKDSLDDARKPSEEYQKFETERMKLAREYAKKDEAGNPMISNNQIILDQSKTAEFEKKFEELKKENQEHVDKYEEKMKEFEVLLKEELEIEPYRIRYDELPDEINGHDLEALLDIIDDPSPEDKPKEEKKKD